MKYLLLPLICYGLYLFCHKQTQGFQLTKIHSTLSAQTRWELPPLDADAQALLQQPFHYLDKGGQSYAFLSQDGTVVLKLFKMHNLRQYTWGYRFALPGVLDWWRLKILSQQKRKLERLFNSCSLAYNVLKEETGLLALNLNPNPALKACHVTLVDALGISHSVSLESVPFALQRRATRALKSLKACVKNHEMQRAHEILTQILTCLKHRQEKGIIDIDPAFKRNLGLSEQGVIFMDIGAFFPAPAAQDTLFTETRHLKRWLQKHASTLAEEIDPLIEALP